MFHVNSQKRLKIHKSLWWNRSDGLNLKFSNFELGEASWNIRRAFRISERHIRNLFRISKRTFPISGTCQGVFVCYKYEMFRFLKSMFRISHFRISFRISEKLFGFVMTLHLRWYLNTIKKEHPFISFYDNPSNDRSYLQHFLYLNYKIAIQNRNCTTNTNTIDIITEYK